MINLHLNPTELAVCDVLTQNVMMALHNMPERQVLKILSLQLCAVANRGDTGVEMDYVQDCFDTILAHSRNMYRNQA